MSLRFLCVHFLCDFSAFLHFHTRFVWNVVGEYRRTRRLKRKEIAEEMLAEYRGGVRKK